MRLCRAMQPRARPRQRMPAVNRRFPAPEAPIAVLPSSRHRWLRVSTPSYRAEGEGLPSTHKLSVARSEALRGLVPSRERCAKRARPVLELPPCRRITKKRGTRLGKGSGVVRNRDAVTGAASQALDADACAHDRLATAERLEHLHLDPSANAQRRDDDGSPIEIGGDTAHSAGDADALAGERLHLLGRPVSNEERTYVRHPLANAGQNLTAKPE